MLTTRFTQAFGLQHPIALAPMDPASGGRLAAAVSNAGALGMVGGGYGCHATLQRELALAGDAAVGCGFITWSMARDPSLLDRALEHRPRCLMLSFADPAPFAARVHAAGVPLLCQVQTLEHVQRALDVGAAAIVAQGTEAGGHRGMFDPAAPDQRLPTATLLRLIARQTRRPVLAAGGIMDGQGIQAALDLGAAGAQLGTAFVLCPESAANAAYRAALQGERAADTVLTAVLSGRPARGIANGLVAHGAAAGSPPPADYPVAYDATKQLNALASASGMGDFAVHWAGQGAPLARAMPAAQLVQALLAERQAVRDLRAVQEA
jgi:nitronate monooxygenase